MLQHKLSLQAVTGLEFVIQSDLAGKVQDILYTTVSSFR